MRSDCSKGEECDSNTNVTEMNVTKVIEVIEMMTEVIEMIDLTEQ